MTVWRAFPDVAKTAPGVREGKSATALDAGIYAELQARLAQVQAERARAVAELKALPPTRPEGAKRLWLPDEGDGLKGWSEAEAERAAGRVAKG